MKPMLKEKWREGWVGGLVSAPVPLRQFRLLNSIFSKFRNGDNHLLSKVKSSIQSKGKSRTPGRIIRSLIIVWPNQVVTLGQYKLF